MSPVLGNRASFSLGAELITGAENKYEVADYNGEDVVRAAFIDNVFDHMVRGR